MTSGEIPDKSITASSQTNQNPAHHGRLGSDTFWCSKDEGTSYIEIRLPKKYKITEARVQMKNIHKIRNIGLLGHLLEEEWKGYHYDWVTTGF